MKDIIKGIKLIVSGLFTSPIKYIRSILGNKSTMSDKKVLVVAKSLVNLQKSVTELESKVAELETGGDILVKCVEAGKELETRLTNLEEDFDDIPILPYKQG
tara:strand:+ start:124 stop:429 length:306 start_codon:yes stop_codon:yes gene_type:complete